MKIHPGACIAHNAAQPQPKTRREIRRRARACFVAPRCHHKAKVKLGPTRSFGRDALRRVLARSFGRDALRRVLARNEYIVIQILRDCWLRQQNLAVFLERRTLKTVSFDSFR